MPNTEFASQNWYDVWFPITPSSETMKLDQAAETPAQWAAFGSAYKAELAALSHTTNLSVCWLLRAGVPLSSRHFTGVAGGRRG